MTCPRKLYQSRSEFSRAVNGRMEHKKSLRSEEQLIEAGQVDSRQHLREGWERAARGLKVPASRAKGVLYQWFAIWCREGGSNPHEVALGGF